MLAAIGLLCVAVAYRAALCAGMSKIERFFDDPLSYMCNRKVRTLRLVLGIIHTMSRT